MSKYYLAYGSNLNKEQMRHRCPGAEPVGTAMIHNCRLEFRRGFLTIEPDEHESVPVGVWLITDEDEKALDRYEGFPKFYYKKKVRVMVYGRGPINGMVYIMTDGYPKQKPMKDYLMTCTVGYADFGLDNSPLMKAYERVLQMEGD